MNTFGANSKLKLNEPDTVLPFDDCDSPLKDHTEPFEPLELKNRLLFGGVGQPN